MTTDKTSDDTIEPVPGSPRTIGTGKGDFVVPDDFDDPLPDDVLVDFE